MKKAVKIILTIGILVFVIVGIIVLRFFLKRNAQIPLNPPNTVGNSAGNLYNGGYFCEYNGMVYFANEYDNGSLYAMLPDQTELTKITSGDISFINAAGDYLYYYSVSAANQTGLGYVRNGRAIYRTELDGSSTALLKKATTDSMILVNNSLYYVDFEEDETRSDSALVTLSVISTDGSTSSVIGQMHPKLGCCQNDILYIAGTESDHYLYAFDTNQQSMTTICEEDMYQPILQNDMIYYMDISDDYRIKAYSMNDHSVSTIVDERVDTFNVYDSIIYYQTCNPDDYALKRIQTDGTNEEYVKSGVYTNVNITSTYVYFTEFGNDLPVYQVSTFGDIEVRNFSAAFDAVTNQK